MRHPSVFFYLCGDFPEGNASNSRLKLVAELLHLNGCSVRLGIIWPSDFNNLKINKLKEGHYRHYIEFKYLNGLVRPARKAGKLLQSVYANFSVMGDIWRNRKKISVVYLYKPKLYWASLIFMMCRLLRKPVITEYTELDSSYFEDKSKNLFYFFDQLEERFFPRWSHRMILISENLVNYYSRKMPADKIVKIPVLVDLERFDACQVQRQKHYISYIGSFSSRDGVLRIINAFSEALKELPMLRLRMIGFSRHHYHIKQMIAQKKLSDVIELTGLVTYDEIPSLLKHSDLFIINRINTSYAHFGSPTKLGEYLACGIPVIATRVGDSPQLLTHEKDAWFIDPENDKQLTEAILLRYKEYERFDEIGRQGRLTCEKLFSHKLYKQVYGNIINTLTHT